MMVTRFGRVRLFRSSVENFVKSSVDPQFRSMDGFLALPEEVSRTVISELLTLTCLSRLDVAYCNHSRRAAFLSLIIGMRTLFSHSLIGRSNNFRYTEMLVWLNNRKLYVRNVSIFTGSDSGRREVTAAYLRRSHGTLERVELYQLHDHTPASLQSAVGIVTVYGGNLVELGFSYLVNLTVSDLQTLACACPKVQKVLLDYCEVIAQDGWSTIIAQHWPGLKHLSLSHTLCSDEELTVVAQGCRLLIHLDVSHSEVSDVSVLAVAAHCPLLQYISLNEVFVGDESIAALAQGCPQLREVVIGVNEHVTDACLFSLASHCHALHTIDISECEQITDAGMDCLAQRCPQLRHLDVSECLNITEQGVLWVAQCCSQLQSLRVYESAASDALLQLLGERVTVCERFNQDDWMYQPNSAWRTDVDGDVHEIDIDGEGKRVFTFRGRVNSDY